MKELNEKDRYKKLLQTTNGDPTRLAKLRVAKQKYSAKYRNIPWKLDDDKIVRKIKKQTHCAISGRRIVFEINHRDTPSIDRIKSNLGYTTRNTQIVSSCVNIAKNDLTSEEFYKLCFDVVKHNYKKECIRDEVNDFCLTALREMINVKEDNHD